MSRKKSIILIVAVAIFAAFALSLFGPKILYYETYELNQIEVRVDSIQISGWFKGASGIGYEGCDDSISEDKLYLTLYQQNLFSSKPLNGSIEIKIDGDFTTLKGIYVVQPKGEAIPVWP